MLVWRLYGSSGIFGLLGLARRPCALLTKVRAKIFEYKSIQNYVGPDTNEWSYRLD